MEFHRQLIHQHHLQSHLHCGNDPTVCKSQWKFLSAAHARKNRWNPIYNAETDPTMIRTWSAHDPTTHETVSQPSHRRGRSSRFGTDFVWKNIGFRASAISQKRISWRDFLQNSIGNSSTSTTCNPIYSEGTILELQITMEFHRQTHPPAPLAIPFTLRERSYSCKSQWNSVDRKCTKHRWHPIYNAEPIRPWSDHDPPMIHPTTHETVSHPSHRRGRSSTFGDALCLEKHRVSCICYLSKTHFVRDFLQNSIGNSSHQHHLQSHLQWGNDPRVANHNGIPSATHPPAPLAIPFTLREPSYSCKSQWNSVDRKCTKHRWHPIYNAEPIRDRSEHDPTTHETVSHPSHRRGRSSTFGDALCLEKHRVSCICYLSKTHFVRDFLQNSIGNSSTSTTCNPIYSEGTISLLTLSVTNSFPH